MIIGDPKHIERLERLGVDTLNEENLDTSFGALSSLISVQTLEVETVDATIPEGDGNA